MALAVSDDHAAQERVLGQLGRHDNDPEDIHSALTEDEISARDRWVKFVALKAYEKAGGVSGAICSPRAMTVCSSSIPPSSISSLPRSWRKPPTTSRRKAGNS